jgi:hypothetical protein
MKLEIEIPENLKEITLLRFQKYNKLITDNEQSEFVNQKTIEIFCGLDFKEVGKIKMSSANLIITHLNNLFEKKPSLTQSFTIGGIEFGFIPDFENITMGEYVDIETYIQDVKNWHKMMAVLYRPIKSKKGKLYEIEEYNGSEKYSEVMKFAPMDAVLGSQVFFYNLGIELLKYTMDSLQELKTEDKIIIQQHINSLNVGDGINQYTQSLEEICSSLKALLN